LDNTPGDRAAECGGGMAPIAVTVCEDGEWMLVHRCGTCHTVHLNRIAGDDDERELLALAIRPLRNTPFPL
jgi:RNHCP domain